MGVVGPGLVLGVQAMVYVALLGIGGTPNPADAVFVFAGSAKRVAAGFDLWRKGFGERIVISPAAPRVLARYLKVYGPVPSKAVVPEPAARSTFENAYWFRRFADRHGWKHVLLVTSAYHAPRSRMLVWIMTAGSGIEVSVFSVTDGSPNPWVYVRNNWKILYNEMIKFWGSLAEALWYAWRGALPGQNPKALRWVQTMKRMFLFSKVALTH